MPATNDVRAGGAALEESDAMNVDEAKQTDRLRGMMDFARRSVPDLRRNAETVEPVTDRRGVDLLEKARKRLAWSRLPGLRPPSTKPKNLVLSLVRRFGFFVLLPTALVAVYFYVFASDQYIAEARFAVRGNVEPMNNVALGEFTSLIQKNNSQDSFVVRDYIESKSMVAQVESALAVSKMFSRGEADFWARYSDPQPIEELTKYWRKRVSASIDVISGIITLTVRAFTPEDALAISKDVIARAEILINDISRRAQEDMVSHARIDSAATQKRLKDAYLAVQTFRNRWGIIDPAKSAESTLTTLIGLRRDKLKAETDLQVLRGSGLAEASRSLQVLVASVAAIDQQIKQLQDQLTTEGLAPGAATNLTQALLEYEGLQVERTIAEKLNESATVMLDRARVAAGKQQIYLSTFVPPTLPAAALFPERGYAVFTTFFCFLVVWSSFSLIKSAIADHRL